MEMKVHFDQNENCTPPDIAETAKNVTLELLLQKSRAIYEKRYDDFVKWCKSNRITKYSQNVMLTYFSKQAEVYKASSLWSLFSMLKATIAAKDDVNIGTFTEVIAFLKRKRVGYQPKRSKIVNFEQIMQFLSQAPDDKFLIIKVALIFGICGACRRQELYNLRQQDITEIHDFLVIKIADTKTYKPRFFVVTNSNSNIDYLALYKKYIALRSNKPSGEKRFFLKYKDRRCVNQVVGINTFGSLAKIIATYLNLENLQLYTGHCFRRTSTTLLANQGANLVEIKRHGGWKSSNVAESYIDESISNKMATTAKILTDPRPSTSTITSGTYVEQNKVIHVQKDIVHSDENVVSTVRPSGSGVHFNNCSIGTINYIIQNK